MHKLKPEVSRILKSTKFHPSWNSILETACNSLDNAYLAKLLTDADWLPGLEQMFSAFKLPCQEVRQILIGESPYPRQESANGYAFWDAAVENIWSETGMTKPVNRATSLRNLIKMLLVAEKLIAVSDLTQNNVASINKAKLVQTLPQLFQNLIAQGFLLLNANLVLGVESKPATTKLWRPFLDSLLFALYQQNPDITLILFGAHAKTLLSLPSTASYKHLIAEHPLNYSFVSNKIVLDFFAPLHLLISKVPVRTQRDSHAYS